MKVRCEYCNNLVDDGEEKCSGCGAINKNYKRVANEVPTTIEELKKWYEDRGLPPYETTRFFIGIDYKDPKAFGIYRDDNSGKFIVYKNKGDGSRAIRYEGTDEKYAVNELYLKLKEEIAMRKSSKPSSSNIVNSMKLANRITSITIIGMTIIMAAIMFGIVMSPKNGYYNINGDNYYKHDNDWYVYSDNDWHSTSEPEYDGKLNDYYESSYYTGNDNYTDIRDSDYYDSSWDYSSDNDSSWDSSSDWDSSDSWDSGGSDWDSDW